MEIFCGRGAAVALFAVASKAELRFIAIESFVLSAVTATIPPCIFLAEGYHDTNLRRAVKGCVCGTGLKHSVCKV